MSQSLPANPSITHLKRQAKDLKRAVVAGDPDALRRVAGVGSGVDPTRFGLRDAQLVIAREFGFDGWHGLQEEVGRRMVDERDLHRWFGVDLNNQVWREIDAGSVTPASTLLEREALLYSAYASAYHWRQVGSPANTARGEHLVARAAIAAGFPEVARHHAQRCLDLCREHPKAIEDWDLAFAHEGLARAAAASGDLEEARRHHAEATALGEAIADPEDRRVFQEELARGPWPAM